jgi:hypothetical protein
MSAIGPSDVAHTKVIAPRPCSIFFGEKHSQSGFMSSCRRGTSTPPSMVCLRGLCIGAVALGAALMMTADEGLSAEEARNARGPGVLGGALFQTARVDPFPPATLADEAPYTQPAPATSFLSRAASADVRREW